LRGLLSPLLVPVVSLRGGRRLRSGRVVGGVTAAGALLAKGAAGTALLLESLALILAINREIIGVPWC